MGIKNEQGHHLLQFIGAQEHREPLTEGAIANLIMVLGEEDRRLWRQMRAWLAARVVM